MDEFVNAHTCHIITGSVHQVIDGQASVIVGSGSTLKVVACIRQNNGCALCFVGSLGSGDLGINLSIAADIASVEDHSRVCIVDFRIGSRFAGAAGFGGSSVVAAAGKHTQYHNQYQQQRKNFLHCYFFLSFFGRTVYNICACLCFL